MTTLSEAIREASCTHNEVTFTGHVFVKKSESDGPLIELSYAGGLENGLVVYLLHMDGAADEFVLAYRYGVFGGWGLNCKRALGVLVTLYTM